MVQLAITLNLSKTNCCDEWEAKLNQDIRWTTTFKKIQRIQAAKLGSRLDQKTILATTVVLMDMGAENKSFFL